MEKSDLASEIIRGEFSRYRFKYSYKEKQMIKEGSFKKVASQQLEKLKRYSWVALLAILLFSGQGIYQIIDFGSTESYFSLIIGVFMWMMVIILTYLYTKEIVSKRNSMKLIIQILDDN